MSVEMKKCKECGKLFTPRNPRQQYCDDVHYRPCPVCGKPVEAKYLSDPARVCSDECKKILAQRKRGEKKAETVKKIEPKRSVTEELENSRPAVKQSKIIKQKQLIKPKSNSNEIDVEYEEMMRTTQSVKEYVGPKTCKYTPGHVYGVTVERVDHVYEVTAAYDFTEHQVVDIMIPVASQSSYHNYFKPVENL